MGRKILGGILGYIVLFIFVFATFSAAYLIMGAGHAFKPGSYDVSNRWLAISTVLGFIGALIGGYTAALIGRSKMSVKITAGIVLLMGLLTIAMVAISPRSVEARGADVPNMEAMSKAQTPLWVAILGPILSIAGVLIGGSVRRTD
jgi:heme A synthase